MDNLFFIDSEKTFTEILLYGQESSLFIWNLITFLFVDYMAMNYVLAAVVTFLLNLVGERSKREMFLLQMFRFLSTYAIHLVERTCP